MSPTVTAVPPTNTSVPPTEPPPPTLAPTAVPTLAPPAPEPKRIEFPSEDGRQLVGTFFPAGINPAPVLVLMHEGLGDRSQMEPLALWLQNRPDKVASGPTGKSAFEWMPDFPPEIGSVAVFSFDMRGHGESEGPMPPNEQSLVYLMDARAAIALAKTLEGVDPNRIMTIGASMFAEAGLNACIALDGAVILPEQPGAGCVGTLSISPFNFCGVPFDQAADALLNTPEDPIVWCLHAEQDIQPETCRAIDGMERARAVIYPGSTHGIDFLQPGLDPDFGEIIVDFLLSSLVEE